MGALSVNFLWPLFLSGARWSTFRRGNPFRLGRYRDVCKEHHGVSRLLHCLQKLGMHSAEPQTVTGCFFWIFSGQDVAGGKCLMLACSRGRALNVLAMRPLGANEKNNLYEGILQSENRA